MPLPLHMGFQPGNMLAQPGEILKCSDPGRWLVWLSG